jgi:hypothetical protein
MGLVTEAALGSRSNTHPPLEFVGFFDQELDVVYYNTETTLSLVE